MNKAEMNEVIKTYAAANEQKKAATAEVAGLSEKIKDYFKSRNIIQFEADGFVATISTRNGKKLNLDKVAALLGGKIPADCYEETETPVLTVKADKKAKAGVTVAKPAAPAPAEPMKAVVAVAVAA